MASIFCKSLLSKAGLIKAGFYRKVLLREPPGVNFTQKVSLSKAGLVKASVFKEFPVQVATWC